MLLVAVQVSSEALEVTAPPTDLHDYMEVHMLLHNMT